MNNGNEDTKLKLQVLDDLQSKDNQIENLKKEIDLVREEAQVEQLKLQKAISHLHENIKMKDDRIRELEQINKEHQNLNGKLQKRLSQYEDKAAHYRRKAVL